MLLLTFQPVKRKPVVVVDHRHAKQPRPLRNLPAGHESCDFCCDDELVISRAEFAVLYLLPSSALLAVSCQPGSVEAH